MNRDRLKNWRRFKRNRQLKIEEHMEEKKTINRLIANYHTERVSGSKKVYDAEAEELVKLLDKERETIEFLRLEIKTEREALEKEISKIDVTFQNVLFSKYINGNVYKSNYEVAKDLHCSESYINKTLMLALREFEKEGK